MEFSKQINLLIALLLATNFTSMALGEKPLNEYAQEIQKFKESDPIIKVKSDKTTPKIVKKLHYKIDKIKQFSTSNPDWINISLNNLNVDLLDEKDAPKLFEAILQYAKKLKMKIPRIYIFWNNHKKIKEIDELHFLSNKSVGTYFFPNIPESIIISEKELRNLTKEEFDVSLAYNLAYLKELENMRISGLYLLSDFLLLVAAILYGGMTFFLFKALYNLGLLSNTKVFLASSLFVLATFFIIGYLEKLGHSKFMRNMQKKADLLTLKILENPNSMLNFLKQTNEISEEEKDEIKKYSKQLLERINSELKNASPTQIQELKKETIFASLGKEKIDPKAYFSNFNAYKERKKYITERLKELKLKQITTDSTLAQKS